MGSERLLADAFQPYFCPPHFTVITSYFNPNHYRTKRANYEIFRRSMEVSNIPCLTVECVFPGDQPDLAYVDNVIRLRAHDIMWQKERLLNIAIDSLPGDGEVVAWLDCDVLFENPEWAVQAARELQNHEIVQLFSSVVRLPRETLWGSPGGDRWKSFGSVLKRMPNVSSDDS